MFHYNLGRHPVGLNHIYGQMSQLFNFGGLFYFPASPQFCLMQYFETFPQCHIYKERHFLSSSHCQTINVNQFSLTPPGCHLVTHLRSYPLSYPNLIQDCLENSHRTVNTFRKEYILSPCNMLRDTVTGELGGLSPEYSHKQGKSMQTLTHTEPGPGIKPTTLKATVLPTVFE